MSFTLFSQPLISGDALTAWFVSALWSGFVVCLSSVLVSFSQFYLFSDMSGYVTCDAPAVILLIHFLQMKLWLNSLKFIRIFSNCTCDLVSVTCLTNSCTERTSFSLIYTLCIYTVYLYYVLCIYTEYCVFIMCTVY